MKSCHESGTYSAKRLRKVSGNQVVKQVKVRVNAKRRVSECYAALQSAVAIANVGKFVSRRLVVRVVSIAAIVNSELVVRCVVSLGTLFCIAGIGCNGSGANGIGSERFQLASSSMAPRLLGPHFVDLCPRCGQQGASAAEAYDANRPTRCFQCGAVSVVDNEVKAGDVVEIVRDVNLRPLRRFDVIVYESTSDDSTESERTLRDATIEGKDSVLRKQTSQFTAKRVWALPGDSIELRDGEAWVNGQQLQKSLREMAEVGIVISRFPADARSHWWVRESPLDPPIRIEKRADARSYRLQAAQRLEFRYARPSRNLAVEDLVPSPLVDDYTCNQNSTAALHKVTDYLVAVELAAAPTSDWSIGLCCNNKPLVLRVLAEGSEPPEFTLQGDNTLKRSSAPSLLTIPSARCLVAAECDGRLLVATEKGDWQWALNELHETASDTVQMRSKPVALVHEAEQQVELEPHPPIVWIESAGVLSVHRLVVERDLWLGPREERVAQWSEPTDQAAKEGYFVLGDNLPLSLDSRDQSIGRIAAKRIVGRLITGGPDQENSTRDSATAQWIEEFLKADRR